MPASVPQGIDRRAAAAALYQQAEVHRLRGEFAAAEEAYRGASQWRLRAAAGPGAAAPGAGTRRRGGRRHPPRARRTTDRPAEAHEPAARLRRDHAGGRRCRRMRASACARAGGDRRGASTPACSARSPAQARGAVELAEGDAQAALVLAAPRLRGLAADRGALRRRARARADRARLPAPSATRRAPRWRSTRRGPSSNGSARRRTSPGSTR